MLTKTEKAKAARRLRTLLRDCTYQEAAKVLWREGYRTPQGKRPTADYVNHIVTQFKLAGIRTKGRPYRH